MMRSFERGFSFAEYVLLKLIAYLPDLEDEPEFAPRAPTGPTTAAGGPSSLTKRPPRKSRVPTPAPVTQTVAAGATAGRSEPRSVQGGAMTYSWTVALGAAAGGADELELTMSANADHYVSWGVAPTLMDGPMIACYVAPSGAGAQCSDWDGAGLTLGPRATRTRVTSWSRQGSGYTVTVRAPMSGMRVLPGVTQRVIWATGAYAAGSNTPLVHTTSNRGAEQISVYSVVVGGATLAPGAPPPTLPPTPAPTTAAPTVFPPGIGYLDYLDSVCNDIVYRHNTDPDWW